MIQQVFRQSKHIIQLSKCNYVNNLHTKNALNSFTNIQTNFIYKITKGFCNQPFKNQNTNEQAKNQENQTNDGQIKQKNQYFDKDNFKKQADKLTNNLKNKTNQLKTKASNIIKDKFKKNSPDRQQDTKETEEQQTEKNKQVEQPLQNDENRQNFEQKQDNQIEEENKEIKDQKGDNSNQIKVIKTHDKVKKFIQDAWNQTFPDEHKTALKKFAEMRRMGKIQKEYNEKVKQYTEEELQKIQEDIPDWKRTSIVTLNNHSTQEKQTLAKKIRIKVQTTVDKSEIGQKLYKSDSYKEYVEFKNVMRNFKEDTKDYLSNSPSNILQGSAYLIERMGSDNIHGKSILKMREFDPNFDLWRLESVAKDTFQLFLQDDLKTLEKVCAEQALGYFRVQIEKRAANKAECKYKQLWSCDRIIFTKALLKEGQMPIFYFNLSVQEIFCLISKADNTKIVDGSDDRIMSNEYIFGLRYHSNPDIDEAGHQWEVVEVEVKAAMQLLV